MLQNNYLLGTLPTEKIRAVRSIEGPHIDKAGEVFVPVALDMMTLASAMNTRHSTDKYFTCYTLEGLDEWPRMAKAALPSFEACVPVTMPCFAFDWDCPDHSPWTDELFEDFFDKFLSLDDEHLSQWRYIYTSRHGARIIFTLHEAVPVQDGEQYIATLFTKFKEAGLRMDEACKDWTRLFRCPHVVRDGIETETEDYYYFDEHEDAVFPLETLKKSSTKVIPTLKHYDASESGGPVSCDEVDDYLYEVNHQGRRVQSAFLKDAKTALKRLPCADALFKANIPLAGAGERNDVIMQSIGAAIPIIIHKIGYATPRHVFALFYGPVTAMEQTRDWLDHLWNAIMTIWPQEVAKYNKSQEEQAEKENVALSDKEQMIEGMKSWCDDPVLNEEAMRETFVERHILANHTRFFFPMNLDGSYSTFPISKEQLISRIRTTHLGNIVQTQELGGMGKMQDIPAVSIQNQYATVVNEIVLVPQLESNGFIEGMDGCNPVLKLPMYRRNPNLHGEYNEDVDQWLIMLLGVAYERCVNWIANSLAFEEGPICALSLTTPPGTGKKLLTEGLAECLERPLCATGKDAVGSFNGALSQTPFLNVNEEWPKRGSVSNQELFKLLTAGDKLRIEEKYKPTMHITNPMRLILTANNHDMIRTLMDKDMTLHDREAVGQRLLHFDLDGAAAAWLEERGGNAFTGRKGARWIAGVVEPSNYLVAKHFLWLYESRIVPEKGFTGRYLVDGNCSKGSEFMLNQIVQKDTTSTVSEAVSNLIEHSSGRSYRLETDGRIYVTINSILEDLKLNDNAMTFGKVAQILRNITNSQEPKMFDYLDHYEIDTEALLSWAQGSGRDTPELRKIVYLRQKTLNKS